MSEEFYYQKYLKYKNKYLALKEYEGGGSSDKGIMVYFCNNKYVNDICKGIQQKTLSNSKINELLSQDPAYKGNKDKSELTFITKDVYNRTVSGAKAVVSGAKGVVSSAREGVNKASTLIKQSITTPNQVLDVLDAVGGGKQDITLTEGGKTLKIDTMNSETLKKIIKILFKKHYQIDSYIVIHDVNKGSICLEKFTDEDLAEQGKIKAEEEAVRKAAAEAEAIVKIEAEKTKKAEEKAAATAKVEAEKARKTAAIQAAAEAREKKAREVKEAEKARKATTLQAAARLVNFRKQRIPETTTSEMP